MSSKTISFYGEEAEAISAVLREKDKRINELYKKLAEREKQIMMLRERAKRLVEHADFQLGGCLSNESKLREIPSRAVSAVKIRHLASLRDALDTTQDLSGLIICDAEPVAWLFLVDGRVQEALTPDEVEPEIFSALPELYTSLYKARKP
jgi:hypothetical protein